LEPNITADDIRQRRVAAGMSIADVASQLDCHTRTIERWESGETQPNRAELIALDFLFSEQVGAKPSSSPARKTNKR